MSWFESWLVSRLLSSHTFHKVVRTAHKKVEEVRRGEKLYHPEDFSGLQIDKPKKIHMKEFLKHYKDELKDQFKGATKK